MVIYGSSRAWVDINPQILEDSLNLNVYNLGIDGHNFWLQYLRHLEYIKYHETPKHIILAVDFNSLQKRDDLYQYEQFLPYMLWNKNIYNYTNSYKAFRFFDYNIPLLRYIGETNVLQIAIANIAEHQQKKPYRSKGFKGIHKNWTNDFELAKSTMDGYQIKLDSASINLFKNFLSECKKNKIAVTLVYTPEYVEGQKFVSNRDTVIQLFKFYAHQYNIKYLDYSNDSICLDTSFFYNATNLNQKGAKLFTTKLAEDLKQSKLFIH
jgi:hypothetical protein